MNRVARPRRLGVMCCGTASSSGMHCSRQLCACALSLSVCMLRPGVRRCRMDAVSHSRQFSMKLSGPVGGSEFALFVV